MILDFDYFLDCLLYHPSSASNWCLLYHPSSTLISFLSPSHQLPSHCSCIAIPLPPCPSFWITLSLLRLHSSSTSSPSIRSPLSSFVLSRHRSLRWSIGQNEAIGIEMSQTPFLISGPTSLKFSANRCHNSPLRPHGNGLLLPCHHGNENVISNIYNVRSTLLLPLTMLMMRRRRRRRRRIKKRRRRRKRRRKRRKRRRKKTRRIKNRKEEKEEEED